MDVKTLCLGLLAEGDACGYDLKKRLEAEFKPFFPAGYGSIYPALASLAADGLVACELEPQKGRPDRKTYRISESGRRRFEQVLRSSRPRHKLRSEFLATLYFAELLPPERIEQLLAERIRDFESTLEHIDGIEKGRTGEEHAGANFVAGFGAAISKAAVEYLREHGQRLVESRGPERAIRQPDTRPEPAGLENPL
jgi:PadR family transcriptional regulator AphA